MEKSQALRKMRSSGRERLANLGSTAGRRVRIVLPLEKPVTPRNRSIKEIKRKIRITISILDNLNPHATKPLNQCQSYHLQADRSQHKQPAFFALKHNIKMIAVDTEYRPDKDKGQHRHNQTLQPALQGQRADSVFEFTVIANRRRETA